MKEEEKAMERVAELEAALENVESILNRIGCRAMFRAAGRESGLDAFNFRLIQEDAVKALEICEKAVRKG